MSSTASGWLIYAGTDGGNAVEVRVSPITSPAPKCTIDDIVPIQATAGCALVPGDETKVTCTAFKNPDGSFERFHVFGRGGPDKISNFSGVPMNARATSVSLDGVDDEGARTRRTASFLRWRTSSAARWTTASSAATRRT